MLVYEDGELLWKFQGFGMIELLPLRMQRRGPWPRLHEFVVGDIEQEEEEANETDRREAATGYPQLQPQQARFVTYGEGGFEEEDTEMSTE